MGQVPAWLDPRAILNAYETASDALEAARAQRSRMNPADVQYLTALEDAWAALPPRLVLMSAATPEATKAAAVSNALQLAGQLQTLTARVVARSGGAVEGSGPGPAVTEPTKDPGWSLPELPDLPEIPKLGLKMDWPILLLVALGLGLVAGDR